MADEPAFPGGHLTVPQLNVPGDPDCPHWPHGWWGSCPSCGYIRRDWDSYNPADHPRIIPLMP